MRRRPHDPRRALAAAALLMMPAGLAHAASGKANPWRFALRAEAEARYDDNVVSLSESEKDALDAATAAEREDRFRLESADDVIFNPSLALTFSREPARGRETSLALTTQAHVYARNGVKDWQQFGLSVRQELNRSRAHRTALVVGGSRVPSYFLRRLADEDESSPSDACRTGAGTCVRNSAAYAMSRAYVEISQEVVGRALSVDVQYARERRDYDHHFDERDSSSDVTSVAFRVYPARGISFRIQPYYEHERRESRGDLSASTTVVDDSVGFTGDLYGLELRWLWGPDAHHRSRLRVYYQSETRDFTTGEPADTGHFGRQDDITRLGAGFSRELGPRWTWGLSAYHRDNDVSISSSKFRKNVLALSLTYGLERSFEPRERSREED